MTVRVRRIINGTKVSLGRTIGYSVWYVVLGLLVISSSFFYNIPVEYFVAYPVLFVVTFLAAFEVARRRIVFWKKSDGSIYSKGGLPIYLFYIFGLIARLAIGYIYIGPNSFLSLPVPGQTLSATALSATIVTDLLLMAGVGLLVGRNMRILRKYLAIKNGKETLGTPSSDNETGTSMPA